jgi:hypothetical protein
MGVAMWGPRSTGEGEHGEGEETECPDKIGKCGRHRMGVAVMCRRPPGR